jgi:hypothetical protein
MQTPITWAVATKRPESARDLAAGVLRGSRTRIHAGHRTMNLNRDYYSDQKYCSHCQKYVSYLMSLDRSYCIECGERVRLFSGEDWSEFNETITRQKPKGGRPRKSGKESA